VYGDLTALLTLMKGLPLAYNRDLQEDKEPAFDASDTVQLCLAVVARMIPAIVIDADAMARATERGFLEATDLADYLAARGLPFREAHAVVGKLVLHCTKKDLKLPGLSLEDLRRFSPLFNEDVLKIMAPEAMVRARDTIGGTAPRRVRAALSRARKRLFR
jgi:argininosuccinate lyase